MRITIISPYSIGAMRGNITTVRRIAHALNEAGAENIVLPTDVFHLARVNTIGNLFHLSLQLQF